MVYFHGLLHVLNGVQPAIVTREGQSIIQQYDLKHTRVRRHTTAVVHTHTDVTSISRLPLPPFHTSCLPLSLTHTYIHTLCTYIHCAHTHFSHTLYTHTHTHTHSHTHRASYHGTGDVRNLRSLGTDQSTLKTT